MKKRLASFFVIVLLIPTVPITAYVINNWWPDGDDIIVDDVFLPAATWSDPAQFQLSEYNEIDTTDNSHPFRINVSPRFSFGANDGVNTMGFLDEAVLNSEYGLSYATALAWTVCWTPLFGSRYDECDVMLDPTRPWSLAPDDNSWFQSTCLHEFGHVRGLGHFNNELSMQNSATSKLLRDEILYLDDRLGIRQHSTTVSERDMVIYRKWHNGTTPQWMTMSPTIVREGQNITMNDIRVENRGDVSVPSTLRVGVYLSTNNIISTGDTLLSSGTWTSFPAHARSTFNWTSTIPYTFTDCSTRWIGGVIDDNGAWPERFEGNNAVTFSNGTFDPTALSILLSDDFAEPNDTRGQANSITLNYFSSDLSIDEDGESDYYQFTLAALSAIDINVLFIHSAGDLDLQLQNSVGSVLASSASVTDNERILMNQLAPGTYYVRVFGYGAGSCNQYALDLDSTACTAEVCNGVDDDCDGTPDDSLGSSTCGQGICQRTVSNCIGGVPQPCTPGAPTAETCNGLDDDCDGTPDDNLGSTTCGQGVCQRTVSNCVGGVPQTCIPGPGSAEVCNGLDDDCDGLTDEDNPGGGGACNTGQPGVCDAGIITCQAGSMVCVRNQGPAPDVCNGLDDDCDGPVDEGLGSTTCGVGECQLTVTNCLNGVPQTCTPGNPSPEVCNNLDDDCSGFVDDNLGYMRCGLGACYREVANCVAGVAQTCTPGLPSAEDCNAIDDDCDGRIDDGVVRGCSDGCTPGEQACAVGVWSACSTAPCCDCTVGSGGEYPDICQAAAAGCWVICVTPGTYQAPACGFGTAVSTQGTGVTNLVGDIHGYRWDRLQDFTIQGSVEDQCGGELIGNRMLGAVVMNDACGDMTPYMVKSNIVEGGLTVWGAAIVIDNIIRGGGIAGGGRGRRLVANNDVTGAASCISFSGSMYGGTNEIYDNRLVGCQNGIIVTSPGMQNIGIVGNEIEADNMGVQVSNPNWMRTDVVGNEIVGFSSCGVCYSGPNEVMGQVVGNLLDSGVPALPGGPTPTGVLVVGSATVQENTIVRCGVGVSAQVNPTGVQARLMVDSNIVSLNSIAGVQATGYLVLAGHNDVYGNGQNWSGLSDPTGTGGNISSDPGFASPAEADWSLNPGSICIDRGASTNRPRDLAGHDRRIDGDLDGITVQDMGAFEAQPEVASLGVAPDSGSISWAPNPYATNGYDVYRGLASEFAIAGQLVTHPVICGYQGTVLDISQVQVPVGEAFVYLVAPHGAVAGSLGVDSSGNERPVTDPCP